MAGIDYWDCCPSAVGVSAPKRERPAWRVTFKANQSGDWSGVVGSYNSGWWGEAAPGHVCLMEAQHSGDVVALRIEYMPEKEGSVRYQWRIPADARYEVVPAGEPLFTAPQMLLPERKETEVSKVEYTATYDANGFYADGPKCLPAMGAAYPIPEGPLLVWNGNSDVGPQNAPRAKSLTDANGLEWRDVLWCNTETGELCTFIRGNDGMFVADGDELQVQTEKTAAPLTVEWE